MEKQTNFTRKVSIGLTIGLIILVAAVAFAITSRNDGIPSQRPPEKAVAAVETNNGLSKVVLNVSNMSCSGCIASIKESLAGIEGINDILVDIGSGKVEVYYNAALLTDPSRIEKAITADGYPATIVKTLGPDEITKERNVADSKARYYIASVGGYDISRADFDVEMKAAGQGLRKNSGNEPTNLDRRTLDDRLKAQVAFRLINEGILLGEIDRAGYKLNKEAINAELREYMRKSGKTEKEFKESILDAGYSYDYFLKKFETGLLINRYVDEKVLAGSNTPSDRQRAFASWFNNAKGRAEVVYYDKGVEQAVKNQTASASCCATR